MKAAAAQLLVLNPNSSGLMTARVVAQVQAQAQAQLQARLQARLQVHGPTVAWRGATAVHGPAVIDSAASFAAGAQAAQTLLKAELRARPDTAGVLLACFGDPGLESLREQAAPRPVWGLADAALRHTFALHGPCAVLTCGSAWVPLLTQRAADLRLAHALVGVWALPVNGAALAADPARWWPQVQQLADEAVASGARALLLGGAAFAGLGLKIESRVPVLDGVDAAAAFIDSQFRLRMD